ncbi:hypothetical protein D0812_28665 [Vibrio owensii]|uniref:Uncharacterized protein n=1 Tax=Vibrio owensii TaxID=696485 RepID=A0AAP9KD78_9VIBR|nr:hypothetical protein [Vibrio owensii]AYO18307.1 hypothetical protein D0812_28665 [Vibrio owensii]QGH50351.1 hypothetical protein APZ19_25070 [Vibrio owensii]
MKKILLLITLFSSLALANVEEDKAVLTPNQLAVAISPLESQLTDLSNEFDSLAKKNDLLEQEITTALSHASSAISKAHQSNKAFSDILKEQQEELSALEHRDVDLSLSMQRDVYPIWVNFFAVLISIVGSIVISVWVTREVLTKTLQNESKTQVDALKANLEQQIELHKHTNKTNSEQHREQITSQLAQHLKQLETQSQLALDEHKEHHKLTIDGFRQQWINDFRDNVTEYVKVILTLCHFHTTEKPFFDAYKELKKAQALLSEYNQQYNKKVNELDSLVERARLINTKKQDEEYISLIHRRIDAVDSFESYKNHFMQYNTLKGECLTIQTKLSLMLKPTISSSEPDYKVRKLIDEIYQLTSTREERRIMDRDVKTIESLIDNLKHHTKVMLKTEWDRIQRKKITIEENT